MIRFLFIATLITVLASCDRPTGIKEYVQNADSVAINYFKGDGTMDTVVRVVVVKDKSQINELADMIEGGTSEDTASNCGYDGSLHFFKNNVVLKDIDFRMGDVQCLHFSFSLNNKAYLTKLSGKAKTFLQMFKHYNY